MLVNFLLFSTKGGKEEKKMEVSIPFSLNREVNIPEQLDPRFTVTDTILDELGRVKVTCVGIDCIYVAKHIPVRDYSEIGQGCYTGKDVVRNEILISIRAASLGIAPRVHGVALNDTEGIIIIDKYDGTLDDLLYLYQFDRSIPVRSVAQRAADCLRILHQNGIVHQDFHPGNIFYTKDGIVAVGDFGVSLISDNAVLRARDWHYYGGILEVIQKIEAGESYEKGEYFEMSSIPPPELIPRNIYLIVNRRRCPYFD